jgi:hypothetical protein
MITNFESIKAVCPIYTSTERNRAELMGSAILLDFGKARFIVTAAHVHDLCYGGRFTLGPISLLPLPKKFVKISMPASANRDDDHLDFAFAQFDTPTADELAKRWYFLPFPLIDVDDRLTPSASYMFSGFPCSRAKADYKHKRIMPRLWTHTDIASNSAQIEQLGYCTETHVAIRYRPAEATDEYDKPRHFPSAKGMSGGAVWRGEGDPKAWLRTAEVRLVGIGIEDRVKDHLMIGVRIHCITALIGDLHPEIRPFALRRTGFTYESAIGNQSPSNQNGSPDASTNQLANRIPSPDPHQYCPLPSAGIPANELPPTHQTPNPGI